MTITRVLQNLRNLMHENFLQRVLILDKKVVLINVLEVCF